MTEPMRCGFLVTLANPDVESGMIVDQCRATAAYMAAYPVEGVTVEVGLCERHFRYANPYQWKAISSIITPRGGHA